MFDCCKSLLKSDPDQEVRKAAAMSLTLLLQGLGQDIIKVFVYIDISFRFQTYFLYVFEAF